MQLIRHLSVPVENACTRLRRLGPSRPPLCGMTGAADLSQPSCDGSTSDGLRTLSGWQLLLEIDRKSSLRAYQELGSKLPRWSVMLLEHSGKRRRRCALLRASQRFGVCERMAPFSCVMPIDWLNLRLLPFRRQQASHLFRLHISGPCWPTLRAAVGYDVTFNMPYAGSGVLWLPLTPAIWSVKWLSPAARLCWANCFVLLWIDIALTGILKATFRRKVRSLDLFGSQRVGLVPIC